PWPVDRTPQRPFVLRHVVIRATTFATGADSIRATRTGFDPRRPPRRRHSPASAPRRIASSRDREWPAAVNSARATAPVSLPAPGLSPPGGAEGFATSLGGG